MRSRKACSAKICSIALNVVTIHIPPLRERQEEIPIFLDFFLRKYSEYYGKQPPPFTDYAVSRMMEYNWPGNIRELENLVKRYVIVGNESQIIRELSTHKPVISSQSGAGIPAWEPKANLSTNSHTMRLERSRRREKDRSHCWRLGARAAMVAEREAIERVFEPDALEPETGCEDFEGELQSPAKQAEGHGRAGSCQQKAFCFKIVELKYSFS